MPEQHRMYHGAVQELAERVLEYVRRYGLVKAGDRVGVAVSGGADSVALLCLLLDLGKELGIVLSVVHFNHRLRGAESDADEKFVAELAQKHRLELHSSGGDVAGYSAKNHLSVEAAGRELRYEYFQRLFEQGKANRIATAHTLDDQAETVLLRLVRGAGTRGLAGIYPRLQASGVRLQAGSRPSSVVGRQENRLRASGGRGQQARTIVRPLLGLKRKELEAYLGAIGQDWREDSSNRDLRYARNRVRHGILPRLERNLNPQVREVLAETAEIARAEEEYWEREVARLLPQVWEEAAGRQRGRRPGAGAATQGGPRAKLKFSGLKQLLPALQRRLVRAVGECLGLRLEFRHVEEVLALASGKIPFAKSAPLPGGWTVSRERNELRFRQTKAVGKCDYEYRLSVPGQVRVREAGTIVEAVLIPRGKEPGHNPDHCIDPGFLSKELTVRNWHPGDRFWPAHRKSPKKIKQLLQELQVSGQERQVWPVVVSGDKIVWVRGFPGSMEMRPPAEAKEAVMIRETPSESA